MTDNKHMENLDWDLNMIFHQKNKKWVILDLCQKIYKISLEYFILLESMKNINVPKRT